jgi:cell wall-associated NlpC family hydrolase
VARLARQLLVVAAAAVASACASSGAVPRPFPTPGPGPQARTTDSTNSPIIDTYAVTGTALALRGAPYRDGGSDPTGFDCSGFVQYVFGQHGVPLPRDVKAQFQSGERVNPNALEPGDLIFFTTVAPGASHVGMAIGGDEFVHAPSSTGVVRVERLSAPYWSRRFIGARRIN